ncbi:hypothetical protein D3C87_1841210 [compost metagenome]
MEIGGYPCAGGVVVVLGKHAAGDVPAIFQGRRWRFCVVYIGVAAGAMLIVQIFGVDATSFGPAECER